MQAPDNASGKKVRCPQCNNVTTAPVQEPEALPLEPAVSEEVPQPQQTGEDEYGIDEGDAEERSRIKRERAGEEERRFRKRKKPRLEAHHGPLILILVGASVLTCWFPIACWALAVYVERLASDDILKMDSGHMDRSGYNLAQTGRMGAYVAGLLGLFGCVTLGYLVTNWLI